MRSVPHPILLPEQGTWLLLYTWHMEFARRTDAMFICGTAYAQRYPMYTTSHTWLISNALQEGIGDCIGNWGTAGVPEAPYGRVDTWRVAEIESAIVLNCQQRVNASLRKSIQPAYRSMQSSAMECLLTGLMLKNIPSTLMLASQKNTFKVEAISDASCCWLVLPRCCAK